MERKLISLASGAGILLTGWLWGRWCARAASRRGWSAARAGRFALIGPICAYGLLAALDWSLFAVLPLALFLARWSCFRLLRPQPSYAEMEEQFPIRDRKPVSLDLNRQ